MAIHYSIIIPTLNEEKFLPKLLTSLAAQTRRDFEVIVVDGSSKDKTVAAAKSFTKKLPKLSVIKSPMSGVSRQRNMGAARAKGEWLLFVDADSVLLPYAIDRIDMFIQNEKPTIFTTWFRPDSNVVGDALVTLFINMIFEAALVLRRPFTQGTFAAVKRDIFHSVGGYDELLEFGEDYDITKRICQKKIKLQVLRETLYEYSLRRYRHQGTLRTMQAGAQAVLSVLLINRTPRSITGYIMGGHIYGKKQQSVLKKYEKKFRTFFKELFE